MSKSLFYNNFDNLDSSLLKSMTFTFSYKGEIGYKNGFEVSVKKCELNNYSYFFIINPIGMVNPRAKATEIYYTLINVCNNLNINWGDIKIVLDLLQFIGVEKNHLFEWIFTVRNEEIKDDIKDLSYSSIEFKSIISQYYLEKYSTFTNSSLSNNQKSKIVSYALAENCYDDFSVENIARNFKKNLRNAVREKKTLNDTLSKLI